jgi:hypothetical protein
MVFAIASALIFSCGARLPGHEYRDQQEHQHRANDRHGAGSEEAAAKRGIALGLGFIRGSIHISI